MSAFIIAEAGVNHNGSLEMAMRMVDVAADAGANAVKFQTFATDQLVTPDAAMARYQKENTQTDEPQAAMLERLELSRDSHHALMAHCKARDIAFLSAPFDMSSVDFLCRDMQLKTIKVPSGELTNGPYLHAIGRYGVDVILSTGMADVSEIRLALDVLAHAYSHDAPPSSLSDIRGASSAATGHEILKSKVTLLHCTTEYPAPFDTINLRAMDTLAELFALPVGLSDHSEGISVPIAAVARGASVVEKHLTLDRTLPGPDHKASIEPDELAAMVRDIRNVEDALGTGDKKPFAVEHANRQIARKGLVAARDIAAGDILTPSDIIARRPERGASPMMYWDLVGTPATRAFTKWEPIES